MRFEPNRGYTVYHNIKETITNNPTITFQELVRDYIAPKIEFGEYVSVKYSTSVNYAGILLPNCEGNIEGYCPCIIFTVDETKICKDFTSQINVKCAMVDKSNPNTPTTLLSLAYEVQNYNKYDRGLNVVFFTSDTRNEFWLELNTTHLNKGFYNFGVYVTRNTTIGDNVGFMDKSCTVTQFTKVSDGTMNPGIVITPFSQSTSDNKRNYMRIQIENEGVVYYHALENWTLLDSDHSVTMYTLNIGDFYSNILYVCFPNVQLSLYKLVRIYESESNQYLYWTGWNEKCIVVDGHTFSLKKQPSYPNETIKIPIALAFMED